MFKNSYLVFSVCMLSLFSFSCFAADPFKGMTPEEVQGVLNATQSLASTSASAPAPVKQSWSEWIGGVFNNVGSSLTKESLDKAEGIVHGSIEKLNHEVIPTLRENLHDGLVEGEHTLKAVVDHTSLAAQQAVDYTGAALQHNLNGSVSHTAHELTDHVIPSMQQGLQATLSHAGNELSENVIPAAQVGLKDVATHSAAEFKAIIKSAMVACCLTFAAFFGAKIAYDGINEYFEDEREDKTKPMIKIGFGGACFAVATYGVWKQF